MKKFQIPMIVVIIVAGIIILGLLTWANYRFSVQNPGGNDFLVHWLGTRMFLREGISPYSDETASEIQTIAYARPARVDEHQLRVAYPLYSIILFFPFSLINDFHIARALWMTTLEAALITLSILGIKLFNWQPGKSKLLVFLIFSVVWYHAIRPLINGNIVILIALAMVGVMLALQNHEDELAGVLLAMMTIKPQVVIVFIVYILYWGIVQKRPKVIIWFFSVIFLLSLSVSLLLPDWILQNLREVINYPSYNPPGTPGSALAALLPDMWERVGWAISGVVILMLLMEWALLKNRDRRGFLWTTCLTLTASQWIGIQTDPGNFIILMPVIVFLFAFWDGHWRRAGSIIIYITMFFLTIGLWVLFLTTVEYGYQPQQNPIMFFPLPGFLLIMLYWVRWWFERSIPLFIETEIIKGKRG